MKSLKSWEFCEVFMLDIGSYTDQHARSLRAAMEAYGPLPEEDWEAMARGTRFVRLGPGRILQTEDQSVIGLALILSGLISLRYEGLQGEGRIKSICEPGQFCGDLNYLLGGNDVPVFIEAIEASELLFVTGPYYRQQLLHRPAVARSLQAYASSLLLRKLERERSLLCASAEARLEDFFKTRPHLVGRIPQKTLAAFLGMAPETLCRLRAKRHKKFWRDETEFKLP